MNRKKRVQPRPGVGAGGECTIRIIGGKYRGRRLLYHGDPTTRPMKDRVREAVFNLLGPMVRDSHVIDLFAGTGALGLEALSRGAQHAVFIERHFPTVDVIRKNVTSLAIESYVEVVASDTFFWALREKGFSKQPVETTWVVFCSPPYAFYVDRADEMVRLIEAAINAAPAGSMIVVESDERFDVRQSRPSTTWDVREYPPARISLTKK